jgi:pimeloyl-ACP methyl ester carboxylesterase
MAAKLPPNLITRLDVATAHGTLDVLTSVPTSPPLQSDPTKNIPDILLIHGNSSSSQIFKSILFPPPPSAFSSPVSPLASTHRIIAFDLPGHGSSADAPAGPSPPYSSHYSMPCYADAALAVLDRFNITSVIVFGHSLGGHIGIELIPRLGRRLKGLMITGTPPVPRGRPDLGFRGMEEAGSHMGFAEAEVLSEEEILAFAEAAAGIKYGGKMERWMEADVRRTDGRARKDMFAAFRNGEGIDQAQTLEREKRVLVAVVNGSEEPFVDLDFCDSVKYGNLWRGSCVRLDGLGHSPFWEKWETFEPVLREYVDDVTESS